MSRRVGPLPVFLVVAIAVTVGLAAGIPLALLTRTPPAIDIEALSRTDVAERDWKYVVIHHSATPDGSAEVFDDFHRHKRGWKNGLGYHFVIGNGTLSEDGEIEVGRRWTKQLSGAHAGDRYFNRKGIGICLVGNFDEDEAEGPTERQLDSLEQMVRHLCERYDIPISRVIMHKDVVENHTVCPGKNFPEAELRHRLRDFLVSNDASRAQS
ncbi:MAG: N-acetylmuramoyl-L-alanine amidase [Planctomycetes bacterium]|nr:N-acetylmuramoyl-L-alanine amidase [Planctomycetota bacterium]